MNKPSDTHIPTIKHDFGGHWYSCSCGVGGSVQTTEEKACFDFNTHYLAATTYVTLTIRVSSAKLHQLRTAAIKLGAVVEENGNVQDQ